jgi:hypothetical protein
MAPFLDSQIRAYARRPYDPGADWFGSTPYLHSSVAKRYDEGHLGYASPLGIRSEMIIQESLYATVPGLQEAPYQERV